MCHVKISLYTRVYAKKKHTLHTQNLHALLLCSAVPRVASRSSFNAPISQHNIFLYACVCVSKTIYFTVIVAPQYILNIHTTYICSYSRYSVGRMVERDAQANVAYVSQTRQRATYKCAAVYILEALHFTSHEHVCVCVFIFGI